MKYCLVKNGAFVKVLPNRNVRWDDKNTLPPSKLTKEQRTQFGVYEFLPADPLPPQHNKGAVSYDIGVSVQEVIVSTPFTTEEIEAEKDAITAAAMVNPIVETIIEWAAPLVGKTPAAAKNEIKDKHKGKL